MTDKSEQYWKIPRELGSIDAVLERIGRYSFTDDKITVNTPFERNLSLGRKEGKTYVIAYDISSREQVKEAATLARCIRENGLLVREEPWAEEVAKAFPDLTILLDLKDRAGILGRSLSADSWSTRIKTIFQKQGLKTYGDLVQKTEVDLLGYAGFGQVSLQEVKYQLKTLELDYAGVFRS